MSAARIKVLVVDDSAVARQLLTHLLESDPQIKVIGVVPDGQSAVDFVSENLPDVVLMDIHMPRLDGFEATRQIMETKPVPIVICTGTTNVDELATTFRYMEVGALACIAKPAGPGHPDFEASTKNLLQTIKLMSEVKVVRRWPGSRHSSMQSFATKRPEETPAAVRLIGIGASTGGPPVVQTILSSLPKSFSVPILIVQHIAHGFLPGLVEWLNQTTGWKVQIGAHGVLPLPGHAYFAPDDFHLGITPSGRIFLSRDAPESGLRPAVAHLFRSMAENCGSNALGVLLTGMGRDGAVELKMMRDAGAETIAQDRESSVVHGMPGEAIKLGAAGHILPPDRMAEALVRWGKRQLFSEGFEP